MIIITDFPKTQKRKWRTAGEYPAEINMGALEIVIIIIGIIIIVGSFFLPEGSNGVEISIPDEVVKDLIEKETKKAIFQIEEHTEETISALTAKTERSMEKLSNEKIMAIDEFSNTIIEKIYKNHEEAVFLYDMLSNKHIQLKNTLGELEKSIKIYKEENGRKTDETDTNYAMFKENKEKTVIEEAALKNVLLNEISTGICAKKTDEENITDNPEMLEEMTVLDKGEERREGAEEKELILNYHKAGKTDVEIARILGMGVGEVKLIIGLFEGNH
ncbi:MAG: hypothetical protein IKW28_09515 [Lachnospiraceae bacterium]|nr:hypothetical protein [Lachnospiraceae bacterium]